MSDRQKLFYALLASAFFHLAVGLVLALWTAQHSSEVAKALPDLTQLTVTIMPPRAAPAEAPPKREHVLAAAPTPTPGPMMRPVLDSDGLKTSSKAPEKPVFQSDSNMVAGSQLPATGNVPLPSMAGPTRKFTDFADRAASMGNGQTAAMPEQTPSAITQVQRPAVAQATPVPTPMRTAMPTAAPTAAPSAA